MFETAAGDNQHDRAIAALNYAFGMQFGVKLFQGLFMALESGDDLNPAPAVARFSIGFDNLLTAYDRAQRIINGKLGNDPPIISSKTWAE